MALDLGHEILAGQGCPVDPSAQWVDDVAEGFIAGDGVVGVLDPELDRAGYLALVSGENGAVDGDLGGCRHFGEVGGWVGVIGVFLMLRKAGNGMVDSGRLF